MSRSDNKNLRKLLIDCEAIWTYAIHYVTLQRYYPTTYTYGTSTGPFFPSYRAASKESTEKLDEEEAGEPKLEQPWEEKDEDE